MLSIFVTTPDTEISKTHYDLNTLHCFRLVTVIAVFVILQRQDQMILNVIGSALSEELMKCDSTLNYFAKTLYISLITSPPQPYFQSGAFRSALGLYIFSAFALAVWRFQTN